MSEPAPEFSRIVRLDAIGRMRWPAHIEADEAERAALARRFGFVALEALEADYSLSHENEGILATGEIRASLFQPCVATAEPVPERVREAFAIRFVPEDEDLAHGNEDEIEIDADGALISARQWRKLWRWPSIRFRARLMQTPSCARLAC